MTVIEEAYPPRRRGRAGAAARAARRRARGRRRGRPPGVIAGVELAPLVALASRENLVVELIPAVGDSVETGSDLMRVWGPGATARADRTSSSATSGRSTQDPMFAFRILVDVAIRALSQAINDPTTATQCLHRIQALLADGRLPRGWRPTSQTDGSGAIRVVVPSPSWDDYLDLGLSEIRRRRRRAVPGRPPHARAARSPGGGSPRSARRDRPPSRALTSSFIAIPAGSRRRFASTADAQGVGGARRSV